jgi:hypothetical protein
MVKKINEKLYIALENAFDILHRKVADLNGSVGSISDLKPKGPGFKSRIRQGDIYIYILVADTL